MDLILIFLGLIFVIILSICIIKFILVDINDSDYEGGNEMKKNNFYDIKPLLGDKALLGNETKITLPNHIKIGTYIFNIKSINFIKYEKPKLYIHYYDINNEIHCVSTNVGELEYKYITKALCTTIIEGKY